MTVINGSGTRERIVSAAGTLFRRQGFAATGLQQIAAASDARVGSIYHFFEGKQAVAEEVIRTSGSAYRMLVLSVLADTPDDPVGALAGLFERAADDLAASDYADACPIATTALEVASTNDTLRQATADVFTDWMDALSAWCRNVVDDPEAARDLAIAVLSAFEGAFILCRALRDTAPLLAAGRSMVQLASAARTSHA